MQRIAHIFLGLLFAAWWAVLPASAQVTERIVSPTIDYTRAPQEYTIGGITRASVSTGKPC